MTINISSPQFSFINFNADTSACYNGSICLPVNALSDLQFMLIAAVTGTDKANFLSNNYAVAISGLGEAHFEPEFVPTWQPVHIYLGYPATPDIYVGYFSFNDTSAAFAAMDNYDCFSLSFIQYPAMQPYRGLIEWATSSTCFYKEPETCFNTLVQYNNNDNAFGFYYIQDTFNAATSGWYNSVRLNLYLHSPVNDEQQQVYELSDGSTQKIMHRIWKDYDFKTDYYPDEIHEKINVATAHDNVLLSSSLAGISAEAFVRKEKIDITWYQDTIPRNPLGQAKGKLRLAIPRATTNSNCD
jgi:hypothetical protein